MTAMTNISKPMEPCVRMALEIEKVLDPHGDSPIGTDQFNSICDVCERWLSRPAPETQAPVESAPALAPFEKLAADLLAEAEKMVPSEYADRGLHGKYYRMDTEAAGLVEAADRLSAKIEEVRGK